MADQEPEFMLSEKAVIGAAIMGGVDGVLSLTETDYYDPRHAMIAAAVTDLARRGTPVDLRTVSDELDRRGQLHRCGESSGLHRLTLYTPTAANSEHYAETVRHWSQRRHLADVATRLTGKVRGTGESDEIGAIVLATERELADTPPTLDEADDDTNDTLGVLLTEPERPTEWLIPGLLSRQERVVMVAGEGVAKSTILRMFAVSMAGGLNPWNGLRVADGLRVLFIDAENSREQSKRAYRWIAGRCHRTWMAHGWKERIIHKTRNGGVDLPGKDAGGFRETAARVAPDVIILGPSYKLMRGDPKDDADTLRLFDVIDQVRVEQDAAVLIESHAPHGSFLSREMRPFGSARWLAWPEIGIGFQRDSAVPEYEQKKRPDALESVDWRGAREERDWPDQIVYGGPSEMPWVPRDPDWKPSVDVDYEMRDIGGAA